MMPEPELPCEHKRICTRFTPNLPGTYAPYVHDSCVRNAYAGIRNRVLADVPEPTKEGLALLEAIARSLFTRTISPIDAEAFIEKYKGKKRKRYEIAYESLLTKPFDLKRDSYLSSFIKAEKTNPHAKVNPDPRVIQARSPRFNVMIGRYIRPIEEEIYGMMDMFGLPMVGKNKNAVDRARLIAAKMKQFKDPVVYAIDASRFDQHQTLKLNCLEAKIYLDMMPEDEFEDLLLAQLGVYHRRRYSGIRSLYRRAIRGDIFGTRSIGYITEQRYEVMGRRKSGEMQTALGNTMLMILMCMGALKLVGVHRHSIFADGDDTLLFVEGNDEGKMGGLIPAFLSFGQEIRLEGKTRSLHQVEWCQARPVSVNGRLRMVSNWKKIVSCAAAGVQHWHDMPRPQAKALSQCILALYEGVPILQPFAEALDRYSQGARMNKDILNSDWMYKVMLTKRGRKLGELATEPISVETRLSFEEAWGLTPSEQELIEHALLTEWAPNWRTTTVGQEIGPNWTFDHLQ